MPTLRQAARTAAQSLAAAGVPDAGRDARLLVAAACHLEPGAYLGASDRCMTAAERARLEAMLARRLAREPVSRILGRREFYGRCFRITPATLDPRPESETLIEAALAIVADEGWQAPPLRILDVGTGSGCLLLSLLAELPQAAGLGTDITPAALEVAAGNAAALGLADRARWQRTRSLEAVAGPFDIVVANPPYVRTADIDGLAPEVRAYDPVTALDGGGDGLAVYREITGRLGAVAAKGWAVLEVGAGQASAVAHLLQEAFAGGVEIRLRNDLSGIVRCVAARALGGC